MSIDPNVLPPGTSVNQPEPPSEPRLFTIAHVERREAELRYLIAALEAKLIDADKHFWELITNLSTRLADAEKLIHEYQDKDVQE